MNINNGPSHSVLPPAAPTNIQGDVALLDDIGDDSDIIDAPLASAPASEAIAEKAAEDVFELPPDIVDSLKDVEPAIKDVEPAVVEKDIPANIEPPKASEPLGRDYTGVEPEVIAVLKQLRNGAYNAVKDQIPQWFKAYKDREALPAHIAQHPEAYKLDKGYQELETGINNATFESSALYNSLMSLKANKPFDLLTGYDDAGKPIYSKIDPTNGVDPRLEFEITEAYRRASNTQQDLNKQHTNYSAKYSNQLRQERDFIEDTFKKIFKDIDPAKFTPDESKYAPLLEKLIPNSVTAADARRIAHYAMVGNLRMGRTLQEYIRSNKGKAMLSKPLAGPSGSLASTDILLDEDKMFGDD